MKTVTGPAPIEAGTIEGLRRLFPDAGQAQAFVNDLIRTFRESGASTLAEMAAMLARDDRAAVARQAHRLKGIGRNLGAVRLGNACAELESQAQKAPPALVRELCRLIDDEFQASCQELDSVYYRAS